MKTGSLALATWLLTAGSVSAQVRVTGVVMNTDSARLAGAQVEMGDSAGRVNYRAVTDTLGRFTIRLAHPLPPGRFFVRSEMLGYRTTVSYLNVANLQDLEVMLTMDVAAIPIEPLRVAVRGRYARTIRDEFYDRAVLVRRMGGGTIVTYDQLQRRAGANVAMIIAEHVSSLRSCPPALFIDGLRATGDDLRMMSALSVEGIEIYRTAGQVPVQYQNRASCGAVLVWSQVGDHGEGAPLSWRRVLIALGLATTALVLLR